MCRAWWWIVAALLFASAGLGRSVHLDLDRLAGKGIDSLVLEAGSRIVVTHFGRNTVNTIYVRNIDADSVLAQSDGWAGQRQRLTVQDLRPGHYEVGFAGCWSAYAVLLVVRRGESSPPAPTR